MNRVSLDVTVAGQPIGDYLASLLLLPGALLSSTGTVDVTLTDNAGDESDTLDLTFTRPQSLAPPKAGDPVTFGVGYGAAVRMGLFTIDRPSSRTNKSGRLIQITATAADMTTAIRTPRHESPEKADRTIDKLVESVAGRYGLTPAVADVYRGVPVPQSDKTAESDMHFLRRIARDVGADMKPTDGRLVFVERGAGRTAGGSAMTPIVIGPTSVSEASWQGGERDADGAVEATYHDQGAAVRQIAKAGDGDAVRRLGRVFADQGSAQRAAEAERKKRQASRDTAEVTIVGNPLIRAGQLVELPALEIEYGGVWTVRVAAHRVAKGSGYTTALSLERPS